jgi:hypothetical protein
MPRSELRAELGAAEKGTRQASQNPPKHLKTILEDLNLQIEAPPKSFLDAWEDF